MSDRRRWLALYMLCAGELMIVLDTTVVNVALPSIRQQLGFSEASLVWVVNAYMLTYGGFLLLGGRLGDLYGQRRLFIGGTALFTLASLVCGIATSQAVLVVARAVQGLGGAAVSAIALSLIMNLFTSAADRAKAMGIYGFVCAGGGSLGVLLGGGLTSALGWHSVFLINLPIGAAVMAACAALLPRDGERSRGRLDVAGAVLVTAALLCAVYGIVNGPLVLLAAAGVLLALFLAVESRVEHPLMPLRLFRIRSVAVGNAIGALWAAAMFAWFFIAALYLQMVLGYDAFQVGLAFLPSNLIMAAFSIGVSAMVVMRFGLRAPIAIGLALAALGLGLFALAPVDGNFWIHVLPGMLLLGVGCGLALNPVMLAVMAEVAPEESGLASGVANTSFMMGGALGLAVLASLAAAQTLGEPASPAALTRGYPLAFALGAMFAAAAAALAWLLLRESPQRSESWATP
jgi:EmrB/QacA subfamily drug resistance transporter